MFSRGARRRTAPVLEAEGLDCKAAMRCLIAVCALRKRAVFEQAMRVLLGRLDLCVK